MTRVGILSMQRIANYGSFLQAYGLKHIIEELGCEVQFVDYHPGKTLIPADGGTGIRRKLAKTLEVFEYSAPFKEKIRFIQYKKNYSAKYFPYLGIIAEYNYFPELDVLVIGSDEVFNCVQNNTNVGFSPELFGQGHKAKKLISYAASFGNTTEEKLNQYDVRDKVAEWLRDFKAVSVRDQNSVNIVNTLTGREPICNLDPVLIYNFMDKCKEIPQTVPEKDYLLLYGYSGRFSKEECSEIKKYADKMGLKVLCIGGVQNCCDRFIDVDPFAVIAYFKSANCVVTDTFHGTILSVIAHRPFVSVVREVGYGNAEKLKDLLVRLKLDDHMVSNIKGLETTISIAPMYKTTDLIIETERTRAYEYLRKEISQCIQN